MQDSKDIKSLCGQVRQTAYEIHVYHGHGHLEKVYENALAHRLRKFAWNQNAAGRSGSFLLSLFSAFLAFFAAR